MNGPTDSRSSSNPHPINTVSAGATPSVGSGPLDAVFPGMMIGPYRLTRELGRGGMGVVFEATDDALDRRVALKLMNAQTPGAADNFRDRFQREGKAVAALKSDHIVSVYAAGEHEGLLYIAMEYIDGPTLDKWLKDRTSSTEQILWIARDLLSGLACAHAKGLIHRDVKPGNVILDESTGRLKLLDFGLVRDVTPKDQTATVGVVGTPSYMSPEQARAERVDARTDLFSAGVVLYRAVTGSSPFARKSIMDTFIALGTETPDPLTGVPAPLGRFVARLMARDPAGRPTDAAAALAELREVEAACELQNARTEPDFDAPRPRSKLPLILAGVAVLLAVAAVVLLTRGKPKDEVAQEPPKSAPQQPAPESKPVAVPKVEPKPADAPRRPLSSAEVLKLLVADIDARPGPKADDDKNPTRLYLFAPHLAPGSSLTDDERKAYRVALTLLSLNLKPGGELLRALDKERTVFAVEPGGEFRLPDGLLTDYPYGLTFEKPESLRRDDELVREYTGKVAFVRADWFVRYAVRHMADGKAVFGTTGAAAQKTAEWADAWAKGPIRLDVAADELGADPEQVKSAIAARDFLRTPDRAGPLNHGKTVPRAQWESRKFASSVFQELARELGLGLPVLTK